MRKIDLRSFCLRAPRLTKGRQRILLGVLRKRGDVDVVNSNTRGGEKAKGNNLRTLQVELKWATD